MKGPGKDGDQRHTGPWGALELEPQQSWFHLDAILRRSWGLLSTNSHHSCAWGGMLPPERTSVRGTERSVGKQ